MIARGVLLIVFALLPLTAVAEDRYAAARAQMILAIEADLRLTSAELGRSRFDERVMKVLGSLPRHEFVPADLRDQAYANRPLGIGHGQTISQPYIVALMTDLLEVKAGDRVLEVGTGSGYQAAVLARLGCTVYTVEIIPQLAESARKRLARLGFDKVHVSHRDGYDGLPSLAPFDAIIVTAAASHIPPPLIRQLANGGRMVIPVGSAFAVQSLTLVTKGSDGAIQSRQILPVQFVPLTGGPTRR